MSGSPYGAGFPGDPGAFPSLPYAAPGPRPAARAGAGAAIIFGGLGLIALGGCFLIGVLSLVSPPGFGGGPAPAGFTFAQWLLMAVHYLFAFACFAGAATLLYAGTRALLRVMNA